MTPPAPHRALPLAAALLIASLGTACGDKSDDDDDDDTGTPAECTDTTGTLRVCVSHTADMQSPDPGASVSVLVEGATEAYGMLTDESGCVSTTVEAGEVEVWAEASNGYCWSERFVETVVACETTSVDLDTEMGCMDG
jgi:hypothetical protein